MRVSVAAIIGALCFGVVGCGGGKPPSASAPVASSNPAATFPVSPTTVSSPGAVVVKRFNGIPMPPNNALDLDRTVVVGSDADWVGRIFFTVPMGADDLVEFYRREMPRYGWFELAAVRSTTSVLSYQAGGRIATIQIASPAGAGSRVEFWMNPRPAGGAAPVLRTAEPAAPPVPLTASRPLVGMGESSATAPGLAPAGRLPVDQAPLPPWR